MQLSLSYAEIVQKIGKQDDRTCRIALKSFAKNKNWRILCTEGTPRSSIGRHVVRHIYRPTLRRCLCQHYYSVYFRRSSVGLQVYLCVDRVSTDMSTNRVGRYDNSSTYRSTGQRHAWWTLLLGLSFLYFFRVFRVWLVSVWPCLAIRNELARKRLL